MVKKRVLYSDSYNLLSIADMVYHSFILISEIGVLRLNFNLQEDYPLQLDTPTLKPHFTIYSVNQKPRGKLSSIPERMAESWMEIVIVE